MKIRSNEETKWSIEGITLNPGAIVEIPVELEAKFEKFIKLGLISVIDAGNTDKVDVTKKVDQAPKQGPIIQKRVSLNNPTQTIYIEKQDNLNVTIDGGLEDKMITPQVTQTTTQTTQTESKVPVTEDVQEIVTIGDVSKMDDTGSVIIPGKKPGEAKLVSVSELVENKAKEVKDVISEAAQELASLKKEEPIKISDIPDRTQAILAQETNKRKLFIAQLSDVDFLLEIAKCTHDKNIQSIINQRLEELK